MRDPKGIRKLQKAASVDDVLNRPITPAKKANNLFDVEEEEEIKLSNESSSLDDDTSEKPINVDDFQIARAQGGQNEMPENHSLSGSQNSRQTPKEFASSQNDEESQVKTLDALQKELEDIIAPGRSFIEQRFAANKAYQSMQPAISRSGELDVDAKDDGN